MSGRRVPPDAPIVTAAAMRAAEAAAVAAGTSIETLMARAGLEVARAVRRFAAGRPVLVVAGGGNNGGDAHVAARHLRDWGMDVAVARHGAPRGGAAIAAAAAWGGEAAPLAIAEPRPVVVDGLLGTGGDRPLDPDLAAAMARLRGAAALTIAIDVPSGVDADALHDWPGAGADVTVALGALKPAHVEGPAAARCGNVLLADLGIPIASGRRSAATPAFDRLGAETQKFARGMVVVIGGAMPGASLLAATAAMHGGAGYVILGASGADDPRPHALIRRPIDVAGALDKLLDDERIGAVVVGPGLGRDAEAERRLAAVLASRHDLVIDGDALSLIGRAVAGRIGADRRQVFLTPHAGEFARLFGEGEGRKTDRTVAAAQACGAVVVHKGAVTVAAAPGGQALVATGATPWLSTAGSGDVLAGLVAACHVRDRARPLAAAAAAVWLHTRAAAALPPGFVADDLVRQVPGALAAARWR